MQYSVTTAKIAQHKTECLILPVPSTKKLPDHLTDLDKQLHGRLTQAIKAGDFQGNMSQFFWVYDPAGFEAKRILFVGYGDQLTCTARQFRDVLKSTWQTLLKTQIKEITTCLHDITVKEHDSLWAIRESILTVEEACYQFEEFKSKKKPVTALKKLQFIVHNNALANQAKTAVSQAEQTALAMKTIKDLANMPPNICHPAYLAEQAKKLAASHKEIKLNVLDEKEMKKLGMNVFLSVCQGSSAPGKLITFEYKGGKANDAPIAFIGKGITFDTGGYSIKMANGMLDMKYDMCGAATVFGIIQFCAALRLPINVVGVVAAAENMINGQASRTSDIYTSMSGLTVEITNTDAEGRLVLCDAMTYTARKFKPKTMITIATLTGAAIIALGNETTALMSNSEKTTSDLLAASRRAEDHTWELPLFEEYHDNLKSECADMINANLNRSAGSITAACFLSRFAEETKWAHLDIAGTAVIPGRQTKPSGRPMPLLMEYLLGQVQ